MEGGGVRACVCHGKYIEGRAHRRLEVKALSLRGRQTGSSGHVGKWLIWLIDTPTLLPFKNVAFL